MLDFSLNKNKIKFYFYYFYLPSHLLNPDNFEHEWVYLGVKMEGNRG